MDAIAGTVGEGPTDSLRVSVLDEAIDDDAVRAVESLAFCARGVGLAGGNNNCVTAMTISDRKRARKKRLSIMEPDRSRLRGTGDNGAGGLL